MTVHVNLMSALKRVKSTESDDAQKAEQERVWKTKEFMEAGAEQDKRFTKDPPMKSFAVKGRE